MTDHLREMALTLANQLGGLPHEVLARAEAYYAFLSQVPQAGAISRGSDRTMVFGPGGPYLPASSGGATVFGPSPYEPFIPDRFENALKQR